jgi:hypothetical protein
MISGVGRRAVRPDVSEAHVIGVQILPLFCSGAKGSPSVADVSDNKREECQCSQVDGFCVFLGMKAASFFRLHESEVWQGLYRLVVEVFWALGDTTGRSGGLVRRSGGAT